MKHLYFRFYACSILCVYSSISSAQRNQDYNQYKNYYNTATSLMDTSNQITGLVGMLSIQPNDTFSLKKLSALYLSVGNVNSSVNCAYKYLQIVPDDLEVLKLHATGLQLSQHYHEALIVYSELYYRTKDVYYKYMQAYMEYELFRQVESLKTIESCIQEPTADNIKMQFSYNNSIQWVSVKAACANLKGLVYLDMKEPQKARDAFGEALTIQPDFQNATKNLKAANKK